MSQQEQAIRPMSLLPAGDIYGIDWFDSHRQHCTRPRRTIYREIFFKIILVLPFPAAYNRPHSPFGFSGEGLAR
jgi:hypothetical protein